MKSLDGMTRLERTRQRSGQQNLTQEGSDTPVTLVSTFSQDVKGKGVSRANVTLDDSLARATGSTFLGQAIANSNFVLEPDHPIA